METPRLLLFAACGGLAGALVLAALVGYRAGATRRGVDRSSKTIDVSSDALSGLGRDYERRAGRAPSPDEERALLGQYLDGEMLYREALALRLDRGDIIIRRRLIQTSVFLHFRRVS